MLELKISKLQDVLSNARLIDETKLDSSKALIFSTVKLKNTQNGSVVTYTLVPEPKTPNLGGSAFLGTTGTTTT